MAAGVADGAGLGAEDHAADAGNEPPEGGADSLAGRGGLSAAKLGCACFGAAAGVCAAGACDSPVVEPETGGAAALVAAPLADNAALALAASGIVAAGFAIDSPVAGIAIAAAVAAAAAVAGGAAALIAAPLADNAALALGASGIVAVGFVIDGPVAGIAIAAAVAGGADVTTTGADNAAFVFVPSADGDDAAGVATGEAAAAAGTLVEPGAGEAAG